MSSDIVSIESPDKARLPISQIKVKKRHRKKLGDIESLKQSIEQIGLLHPVVVNEENVLIAGMRRLEACKMIDGMDPIPVHVVPLKDIARGEHAENPERLDFQLTEAVAIAREVRVIEEREAKKRKQETGRKHGRGIG